MQTHHWPAQQRVHSGPRALDEALPAELDRLGWHRVLLVTTQSLRNGELCAKVRRLIDSRWRATVTGIPAHSPIDAVARLVGQCQHESIDGIVALGGGSVIDACKGALAAINSGIDASQMSSKTLLAVSNPRISDWGTPGQVRMIVVPTTLSAAEFTSFCGLTDTQAERKISVGHPSMIPICVIQDPAATLQTPARLLLSTGARSVDHAVEGFCATNASPFSDATAIEAARRLFKSLPALAASTAADAAGDTDSTAAHADAQAGAWLSIQGRANGVSHGASHGIGYILGAAFGVPHGETSCVMLPAVLRWNESVNGARQAQMRHRLDLSPDRALADHVEQLFAGLGLPTRLSQVGVSHEQFDRLVGLYNGTGPIATNPRPVRGRDDLLEILALAA